MLDLQLISQFTCFDLLICLTNQCLCLINDFRMHLLLHVNFLNAVVMENSKTTISRKYTFKSVPSKFDTNRAHLAEGTLNNEGFFTAILHTSKLPLNIILVAHVIVVVNSFLRCLKMARKRGEVKKFQLLPHTLYLALINH